MCAITELAPVNVGNINFSCDLYLSGGCRDAKSVNDALSCFTKVFSFSRQTVPLSLPWSYIAWPMDFGFRLSLLFLMPST